MKMQYPEKPNYMIYFLKNMASCLNKVNLLKQEKNVKNYLVFPLNSQFFSDPII